MKDIFHNLIFTPFRDMVSLSGYAMGYHPRLLIFCPYQGRRHKLIDQVKYNNPFSK